MNQETDWLYGILCYFSMLKDANKKVVKLCGQNGNGDLVSARDIFYGLSADIVRLIPSHYDKNQGKIVLSRTDGILDFKNHIDFIETDFDTLLTSHYDIIDKIRKLRNPVEHSPHTISPSGAWSGKNGEEAIFISASFLVDDKVVSVKSDEFIKIIRELNIIFIKIFKKFEDGVNKNNIKHIELIRAYQKYDFKKFNDILDLNSNILNGIGILFK